MREGCIRSVQTKAQQHFRSVNLLMPFIQEHCNSSAPQLPMATKQTLTVRDALMFAPHCRSSAAAEYSLFTLTVNWMMNATTAVPETRQRAQWNRSSSWIPGTPKSAFSIFEMSAKAWGAAKKKKKKNCSRLFQSNKWNYLELRGLKLKNTKGQKLVQSSVSTAVINEFPVCGWNEVEEGGWIW